MTYSRERIGEFYIFFEALLWGLFPVFTVLSLFTLGPFMSLALTTFFAWLFFLGMVTYKNKWHELKNTSALKDVLITVVLLGVLFYVFFFWGLTFTTTGDASLIALMEIFFTFLIFNVFRGEHTSVYQILGATLMIVGGAVIVLPEVVNRFSFNTGHILIVCAVIVAPVGNFFQRRARETMSSEVMLFVRTLCTIPFLLILAYVFGESLTLPPIDTSFIYIVLSGVFLLGLSKIFWVESIHRLPMTKAIALASLSPLFTMVFSIFFLKQYPTVFQLIAFVPLFLGVILLTRKKLEPDVRTV